MIEILISVIILSIGLLGIAGLQVAGMKNNHSAYLRTQATTLAYQFADILRSNLTEVQARKLGGIGSTLSGAQIQGFATGAGDCVIGNTCTSTQMMEDDLQSWVENIEDTLPEGRVSITNPSSFNDTNNNYLVFGITITWKDDRVNDVDKSFTTSFRP